MSYLMILMQVIRLHFEEQCPTEKIMVYNILMVGLT